MNHKWDAQYKMLVAANGKEITDLKAQIKALSLTHSSGGSEEDSGEKKVYCKLFPIRFIPLFFCNCIS